MQRVILRGNLSGITMSTSETNPGHCRQSRIPAALQAVFLASNRGKDVHKPPPEKVANKVFFGNWLFQRKSTYAKTNNASAIESETNSQPFNEVSRMKLWKC